MKLNIHAGHTKQSGHSPGASGYFHESVENRRVKKYLKSILRKRKVKFYDCTSQGRDMYDNMARIVKKCNKHKVDIDLSIHFNSSNGEGHGVEAWIYPGNEKSKKYATRMVHKISGLGFQNRGVKTSAELYVIRHTNSPAIIIEICFCDNKYDSKQYKNVGASEIAKAIADSLAPVKKGK